VQKISKKFEFYCFYEYSGTICTVLGIAQVNQLMTVKGITNILQNCVEQYKKSQRLNWT